MADSRRPVALLAVGALVGLGIAALGLLSSHSRADGALPRRAVATVNGSEIPRDKLERLVAGLERELGREATRRERQHVLDRVIEEELLVQRGLELGLARHDRGVRAKLVAAMLEEITSNDAEREPATAELRSFCTREAAFFATPGRLRVARIVFRQRPSDARMGAVNPSPMARARAARASLGTGERLEAVRAELGDSSVLAVPDALLPPAKLRTYLGPAASRAVEGLAVGQVTRPIPLGSGVELIQLLERTPARTPAFEAIEPQVRAEWIRRAGDRALRRELDLLRGNAKVIVASDLQ